jgi:hypothetical protein
MRSIYYFGSAFLLAFTTTAAAQDIEGRFQLGLSTDLVSYTDATLTNDDNDEDVDITTTRWGIRESVLLELGYGVSEMIVIGAMATLGGASQTIDTGAADDDESSEFTAVIGPKIDVVLSPGSTVRPFVGAAIAFATTTGEVVGGAETTITGFELGGRLGLHWFAAEGFSVAPSLAFIYASGSGEIDLGPMNVDISMSGIDVALMLGASGWLD